jgi:hypothetical protein
MCGAEHELRKTCPLRIFCVFMAIREYEQIYFFFMTTPIFQLLLCLSGRADDPSDIMKGTAIGMNNLVPGAKPEGLVIESLQSYGMQLSFYMGDIEQAAEYYEQLKDVNMGILKATMMYHVQLFFFSLVCIESFRTSRKNKFKNEAKKYMDTLRELVGSGAINLVHKLQLLDAEFTSLTAKDTYEVVRKYERATVSASRAGFLQDGALSNYQCAKFCLRQEATAALAETYVSQSYDLYQTWGASAVADSVKQRHPSLFPEKASQTQNRGTHFRSRPQFQASYAIMHKSLSTARGIGRQFSS